VPELSTACLYKPSRMLSKHMGVGEQIETIALPVLALNETEESR
jgi:hypothetical protein